MRPYRSALRVSLGGDGDEDEDAGGAGPAPRRAPPRRAAPRPARRRAPRHARVADARRLWQTRLVQHFERMRARVRSDHCQAVHSRSHSEIRVRPQAAEHLNPPQGHGATAVSCSGRAGRWRDKSLNDTRRRHGFSMPRAGRHARPRGSAGDGAGHREMLRPGIRHLTEEQWCVTRSTQRFRTQPASNATTS